MAKLILVKNIFNPEEHNEEVEVKAGITVREYIHQAGIDLEVYENECECYDPETDTWSTEVISDNADSPLNISIIVNKDEQTLDYVIKENDEVVITILPASSDGMNAAASLFGVAAGVFAAVAIGMGTAGVGWMMASVFCTILSATLSLAAMDSSASSKSQKTDDEAEESPSLTGTQNQSLIGNPFPAVIGSLEVTPFVIGSPYNDFIIKTENGVPTKASRYGNKTRQTLLLGIGYAPLFIKDIKLNSMPLCSNPNNILSGLMTNDESADKFEGVNLKKEIGSTYKSNNFRLELSQFGNHRTIYPYSVKQKNLDVALLYCYDNEYSKIATDHQISWQGATFPTGMRTNSIYFSEAVPYKIAVGIQFPKGLYMEHTDDDGDYIYNKIPMHLAIQWRPVYKYTEDVYDSDDRDEKDAVYDKNTDGYTAKRYGAWRNFDNSKDKEWDGSYWHNKESGEFVERVPCVKYTNNKETIYKKYLDENGNYLNDGENFYYECTSSAYEGVVTKVPYAKVYKTYYEFRGAILNATLDSYQKNYKVVKDQYVSQYNSFGTYGSTYKSSESNKVIGERELLTICSSTAKAIADTYFNNQGAYYAYTNSSTTIDDGGNAIAAREVHLNYGLSDKTSVDSNPNWNGVDCFAFGKYSCGPKCENEDDPGQTDVDSFTNLEDAKDSMAFEITATLEQEDILDLLNKNPLTNSKGATATAGKQNVVTDCIEIRVVRLTPCYIDKVKDKKQYTYSDIVKWTYIKTYCLDKTALQDDCEKIIETIGDNNYTKINCVSDGSKATGGYAFNDWKIADYRSKPLDDADQQKMVTLAVECEPDSLGYVKDNLKKISVRASAITPALKKDYIRLWRTVNNKHYYYDSYDTEELKETSNIPEMSVDWILDDTEIYEASASRRGEFGGIEYQVMNREWEYAFFPKVIRRETLVQLKMRTDGNAPECNDKGEFLYDTANFGNSWFRYISTEMSRHQTDSGKWVAKKYFIDTFTGQNAIAQILGFMCGKAIGKEAKIYNSTNNDYNIRLWYVNNDKYYYFDTDYTAEPSLWHDIPVLPDGDNLGRWIDTTKEYYDTFTIEGSVSSNISWCWSKSESSFNMLSVKESYLYTNEIDFKGKSGAIQWNYNLYLTSQKKLADVFKEMLVGALAYWYYDDLGRYEIHNDKPRTNPVLLITDEDCISSSNTREFKDAIGGYHITFNDEDNGGRQGEIYVLRSDQNLAKPTRDIVDLALSGITNSAQAWAYGCYMLGQTICQRESWVRKLNHIGHSLRIGSLVEVQGSTLMIGTDHSGRIEKLLEDDKYIYGFILDGMYEYRAEYNEDGTNVQGCTLMQSSAEFKSRIVTLRFASKEQQENGITVLMSQKATNWKGEVVDTDKRNITFKNNKGDTNLVLFEKKIVKDENSLEYKAGENISVTCYDPKPGDVVAFGNVDSITSKAVVYELSYDNKGQVSVSLYPYFESVYSCGDNLPVYQANLTKKERSASIPVNETYIELGLNDYVDTTKLNEAIKTVQKGTTKKPETPLCLFCKADRDGITISVVPQSKGNLSDQLKTVKYVVTNPDGITVQAELEANEEYTYLFNRDVDHYPEADRVKEYSITFWGVNVYNIESDKVTVHPDNTGYGTWKLNAPLVNTRISDRTATLIMGLPTRADGKSVYGDIRYKIAIQKPGESDWFCPASAANPYGDEDNYKDTKASSAYIESGNVYSQCLPLQGQSTDNIVDTPYNFKVIAFNEAGSSESVIVGVVALCTSIRDIVKANETAKKAYIEELSAISANIGVITEGSLSGNDNNYWALSDIPAEDASREFKQGEFRVGDDEQYIQFTPKEKSSTGHGIMNIKANLDVDADFANIKGELSVYPLKTVYKLSEDTEIVSGKKYYTRTGSSGDYEYTKVENPVLEDLLAKKYYEEDTSERKPAFQVIPSEVLENENITAVNGEFVSRDESIFGTSTIDTTHIRQFLNVFDTNVQIILTSPNA